MDVLNQTGCDIVMSQAVFYPDYHERLLKLNVCYPPIPILTTVAEDEPWLFGMNGVAALNGSDILVADIEEVKRIGPDGSLEQTYNTGANYGWIDVDAGEDGTSFWALMDDGSGAWKFSADDGSVLAHTDATTGDRDGYRLAVDPRPVEPTTVIFIHGITQDYTDPEGDLFSDIRAALLQDSSVEAVLFPYFQDKGLDAPECASEPLPYPSGAEIDNLIDWGRTFPPGWECDSESDIPLNVLKLAGFIEERSNLTGRPLILVTHSMGGAIARGYLTYAAKTGLDLESRLSAVFFLAAVHDGSEGARDYLRASEANVVGGVANTALGWAGLEYATDRPAIHQLVPQSDWFQWANPQPPPQSVAYFNYLSDIRSVNYTCFLFWCRKDVLISIGDVVLARGTDSPTDTPKEGGAAFVVEPEGPVEFPNWQWVDQVDVPSAVDPEGSPLGSIAVLVSAALSRPQFHSNIIGSTSEIQVDSCVEEGEHVPLTDQFAQLIVSIANEAGPRCSE